MLAQATASLRRPTSSSANSTKWGLTVEKVQVRPDTNPLVLARSPAFSQDRPTVLIYGHYDVQGVDNPRSAWEVDPFAAEERDGFLIARGASDNKGPCFAHLKAAEVVFANGNQLPFNLVFLIEGEGGMRQYCVEPVCGRGRA